jgi:hypothetical protein
MCRVWVETLADDCPGIRRRSEWPGFWSRIVLRLSRCDNKKCCWDLVDGCHRSWGGVKTKAQLSQKVLLSGPNCDGIPGIMLCNRTAAEVRL